MKNYKEFTIDITINASKEKVWDVVYNKFSDVADWHPLLEGAEHIGGTKGEIGCERSCTIDSKTKISERITAMRDNRSFDIDIFNGNLPMMKEMQGTIDVDIVGENKTRVTFKGKFIPKYSILTFMMKKGMMKMMGQVVLGLKYFIETGNKVNKNNFKKVLEFKKINDKAHKDGFNLLQVA